MSPFANQLKLIRLKRCLRQSELAELLGCKQSYLSGLELGIKGPPSKDFTTSLIRVLQLDEIEQSNLEASIEDSQRNLKIDREASEEVYRLMHRMAQQHGTLHPIQIELINTALDLRRNLNLGISNKIPTRIVRRDKRNKKEEVEM